MKKNPWKFIFYILLVIFIGLLIYVCLELHSHGNSPQYCYSATNCECNSDNSDCICHYYDDEGKVSEDTIHCDLSRSSSRG